MFHACSMHTAVAHQFGIAAEETAARGYCAEGGRVRATRWRCPEGELDLVLRDLARRGGPEPRRPARSGGPETR